MIIDDPLEERLRGTATEPSADLAAALARADASGLIDVAYATTDSPVGPLLAAATPLGLVRVAFDREDDGEVLDDLAARVSPRVREAPGRLDEVRRELDEARGPGARRNWRGHSDTETLVEAIAHWGLEATLAKVVGMFAIALWDRRDRVLRLVRDRFGEKPLYYGWVGGDFVYGSELKSLRTHARFDNGINREALGLLAARTYIPAHRTGGYAILLALYSAGLPSTAAASVSREDVEICRMSKEELVAAAQPFCDASFTVPKATTGYVCQGARSRTSTSTNSSHRAIATIVQSCHLTTTSSRPS